MDFLPESGRKRWIYQGIVITVVEGYILEGNQSADVFEWLCIRGILDFRLCLHHGKEPFESGEAF